LPIKNVAYHFLLFTALSFAKPSANLQTIDQSFLKALSRETVSGISLGSVGSVGSAGSAGSAESAESADIKGLVWSKGNGHTDLENQISMTNKHKMRIGSIAKLITVAGMMRFYQ
jgi:CubicO group peptidase (beta-lactamase class C family)